MVRTAIVSIEPDLWMLEPRVKGSPSTNSNLTKEAEGKNPQLLRR